MFVFGVIETQVSRNFFKATWQRWLDSLRICGRKTPIHCTEMTLFAGFVREYFFFILREIYIFEVYKTMFEHKIITSWLPSSIFVLELHWSIFENLMNLSASTTIWINKTRTAWRPRCSATSQKIPGPSRRSDSNSKSREDLHLQNFTFIFKWNFDY